MEAGIGTVSVGDLTEGLTRKDPVDVGIGFSAGMAQRWTHINEDSLLCLKVFRPVLVDRVVGSIEDTVGAGLSGRRRRQDLP